MSWFPIFLRESNNCFTGTLIELNNIKSYYIYISILNYICLLNSSYHLFIYLSSIYLYTVRENAREREGNPGGTVPGSSKCAFSHLTVLLRRWSFLYNVWELHNLAVICLWVSSSLELFCPQIFGQAIFIVLGLPYRFFLPAYAYRIIFSFLS